MNSELLVAAEGSDLVAIFDPHGRLDEADQAALRRSMGKRVEVAACDGRSAPQCWLAGRLDDASALAIELGLPSDADVFALLRAGRQRLGDDLFRRLRGQFVLVCWDPERREAIVVGDQLGVHSPFLYEESGKLYIATRLSLLLRLLPRQPAPDRLSVLKALSGGLPVVEKTLFEGVERLPGGDLLRASSHGKRTQPYWRPRYEEPAPASVDEASEMLWAALRQAVRRRLEGTASPGIVLSGGVDSTSVAAAAVAEGFAPETYSTVFPGRSVDESPRIDAVVEALDLPNLQMQVEPAGSFALFLEYLEATGLLVPGAGYLIERPLLQQAAAAGVTGVLDGQGGDELFSVSGFLIADRVRRGRLRSSVELTRRLPGAGTGSRKQLLRAWRFYVQGGALPYGIHTRLKRRRALRDLDDADFLTSDSQRLLIETDTGFDWKRHRTAPLWWLNKTWLLTRAREAVRVTDYLRERAALAGIEAMPPLFDLDLIETSFRIAPETEFDATLDRPLIRRATAGLLPDEVRLSTFKSNLAPFFLEATLRDQQNMLRVLEEPELRLEPYVNVPFVRDYFRAAPSSGGMESWRWSSALWRLVTLECWLRSLDDAGYVEQLRSSLDLEQPVWSVHRRRAAGSQTSTAGLG